MTATLYYVHDPMCSWCWAFRPVWSAVQESLPPDVEVRYLLGGLAPDSDSPMPDEMRRFLRDTWHRIEQKVPGTRFNFDFWEQCRPRRTTYPAYRAIVATRRQGVGLEQRMIHAIQRAYYQQAHNPSNMATLVEPIISSGPLRAGENLMRCMENRARSRFTYRVSAATRRIARLRRHMAALQLLAIE